MSKYKELENSSSTIIENEEQNSNKIIDQQQQKKQKPVCIVKPFKVENKNTNNHVRPSQTQRNQESSSFVSWIGENVWKIAFGVAVVAGGAILMTSKGRSGNDNDEDDD